MKKEAAFDERLKLSFPRMLASPCVTILMQQTPKKVPDARLAPAKRLAKPLLPGRIVTCICTNLSHEGGVVMQILGQLCSSAPEPCSSKMMPWLVGVGLLFELDLYHY